MMLGYIGAEGRYLCSVFPKGNLLFIYYYDLELLELVLEIDNLFASNNWLLSDSLIECRQLSTILTGFFLGGRWALDNQVFNIKWNGEISNI